MENWRPIGAHSWRCFCAIIRRSRGGWTPIASRRGATLAAPRQRHVGCGACPSAPNNLFHNPPGGRQSYRVDGAIQTRAGRAHVGCGGVCCAGAPELVLEDGGVLASADRCDGDRGGVIVDVPPSLVSPAESLLMSKPIRRVVTGHNAQGKSIFVADGPSPHVMQRGTGSVTVTELWETRATPADNRGNADAIDRPFRLHPPKNGTVLRVIEYPPDRVRLPALAREAVEPDDGSGRMAARDRGNPRHAGFHKTDSVDYAIVLSGEIV